MDKRKRNITALGLLVVIAVTAFVWGMYYLLGNPVWAGGLDLIIQMADGAGLKRGDRVYLSGVDVGLVQNVRVDRLGGVFVEVRVQDELDLPGDTHAAVMGDVFGAHTVDLRPGQSTGTRLVDNDTIIGTAVPEITELAVDLSARASALMSSFDSLVSPAALSDVHATAAVLPGSVIEMRAALQELKLAAAAVRRTTEEVEAARTGATFTGAVSNIDANLERSTTALTAAASSMERSLLAIEQLLGRIDRGEGTLGRLVNDASLYDELGLTLREFRLLATDIRERPGRYISVRIF